MVLRNLGLLLLCLMFSGLAQAGQALLWQVERDGRVSHLFGTIHSPDSRLTQLPPPVEKAFSASEKVVLEMRLDAANSMAMVNRMMLPSGEQLKQRLPDKLYADTLSAASELGYPEAAINRMQPWAVALTLSFPPGAGPVLDQILFQRAVQAGKPVDGLETVDEQVAVFAEFSPSEQVALLRQVVAHSGRLEEEMQRLTQAYLARDLDAMRKQHEQSLTMLPEPLANKFNQRLVSSRDDRMTRRLVPILKEGDAFVAVGALHLPGIVRRLRERGYTVSARY